MSEKEAVFQATKILVDFWESQLEKEVFDKFRSHCGQDISELSEGYVLHALEEVESEIDEWLDERKEDDDEEDDE